MQCLNKNNKDIKDQIDKLSKALGSEEAAYYIVAMNNGYPIDRMSNGVPSQLYTKLLSMCEGDENEAARQMSKRFLPEFVEKYPLYDPSSEDGDYVGKEPNAEDLTGETIDIQQAVNQSIKKDDHCVQALKDLLASNNDDHSVAIREHLNRERDEFVRGYLVEYRLAHPEATEDELSQQGNYAGTLYDDGKLLDLYSEIRDDIAQSFGMIPVGERNGVTIWKSRRKNTMLEDFINSLTAGEYETHDGRVMKGVFSSRDGYVAAANVLYATMLGQNYALIKQTLIRNYLQMFWGTDVVQEALSTKAAQLKRRGQEASSEELLRDITADIVIQMNDSADMASLGRVRHFFAKIKEAFSKLFVKKLSDRAFRMKILDTVYASFMLNEDLSGRVVADIIWNEVKNNEVSDEILDEINNLETNKEKRAVDGIITSLRRRIKFLQSEGYNPVDLANLKSLLAKSIDKSYTNREDVISIVTDTMIQCSADLIRARKQLNQLYKMDPSQIDIRQFVNLRRDIIGYYEHLLTTSKYFSIIGDNNASPEFRRGGNIYQLYQNQLSELDKLKKVYSKINDRWCDWYVDRFVEDEWDFGNKENLKANMRHWLHNEIEEGYLTKFSMLETYIGPAAMSKSMVVRMVDAITRQSNREVHIETTKCGNELSRLFQNAFPVSSELGPMNAVKVLIDKDKLGAPTGYFRTPIRYGKAMMDRDDFMLSLIKDMNKRLPKEHQLVLNDDFQIEDFHTDDIYKEFNDRLDKWLDGKFHRRYTAQYYIDRRRFLNRDQIEERSSIQAQINYLLDKCYDEELNMHVIGNLDQRDYQEYKRLCRRRRNLSSLYNVVYDTDGSILELQMKEGKDLEDAIKQKEWENFSAQKSRYVSDWTKYDEDRQKLALKYGENSPQVKKFEYHNSSVQINKKLMPNRSSNIPEPLQRLYDRRASIKRLITEKSEFAYPNLSKLNDQAYQELKEIDTEISKYDLDFDKNPLMHRIPIMHYDKDGRITNKTEYEFLQEVAHAKFANGDENALSEFNKKYNYVTDKGHMKPLSIFFMWSPVNETQDIDGEVVYSRELQLSGEYTMLDVQSEYADEKYDYEDSSYLQPDKDVYEDKDFEKDILSKPKIKALYDALIKYNKLANRLRGITDETRDYMLPPITDDFARVMFRTSIASQFKNIAEHTILGQAKYGLNENDIDYNDEFQLMPDGSQVLNPPKRYVKRLRDPRLVCTDVVSTIIMQYEQALNYSSKRDLQYAFEAILFELTDQFSKFKGGRHHQSERLSQYMEMYVYGRMKTGFGKRFDNAQRTAAKLAEWTVSKASKKFLSWKLINVLKNMADSMFKTIAEIIGGKHATYSDALFSSLEMLKEMPKVFSNFGSGSGFQGKISGKYRPMLPALMEYNGIASGAKEQFGGMRNSVIRNVIGSTGGMSLYSLVDYSIKAFYTGMVYHNRRLVSLPDGTQQFLTKNQAGYIYQEYNRPESEGRKAWKRSKTVLFDAYKLDKDGNVQIKNDYYKNIIRPVGVDGRENNKLERRVETTIKRRTSYINGMLEHQDRSSISANYFGAMFMHMRGWQVETLFEYLAYGNDFDQYDSISEIDIREHGSAKFLKDKRIFDGAAVVLDKGKGRENMRNKQNIRGMWNFNDGDTFTGQWRGLHKSMGKVFLNLVTLGMLTKRQLNSKKLTHDEVTNLKKFLVQLTALAFCIAGSIWAGKKYDELDPEDYMRNVYAFIHTFLVESTSEQLSYTPYTAATNIVELTKSPFASASWIVDTWDMIGYSFSTANFAYKNLKGEEDPAMMQPVSNGSYKGLPTWQANVLKIQGHFLPEVPIANLYRSLNENALIQTSRQYQNMSLVGSLTYKISSGKKRSKQSIFVNQFVDEVKPEPIQYTGNPKKDRLIDQKYQKELKSMNENDEWYWALFGKGWRGLINDIRGE